MSAEIFETINAADNTKLVGRHWALEKPKAVMSLVHGLGEHSGRYEKLVSELNDADIAVVALDLRGHGQSDGKRGVCTNYDLLRGDLKALLQKTRALYLDTPHMLYGHSMGGGLVLDYGFAADKDIFGVIASAPFIGLPKPPPKIIRGVAKLIRKISPEASMSQPLSGDKISTLPEEQGLYENDPLNHSKISFSFAADAVEVGEAIAARAAQWTKPLLLMHAKGDQLTSFDASEAFASKAQNVIFKAFENSEHEMHNDTPRETVIADMIGFIENHI
jgi:alpha-beta hydrolase superfamily lysophospholipase